MVGVGRLPGFYEFSQAAGVSDGGSVVVGTTDTAVGLRAFRWTGPGTMTSLGTLPGGSSSWGHATSADGAVVVGYSFFTSESIRNGYQAFRWTAATGMVGIGTLGADAYGSEANDVSGDGVAIVGVSARMLPGGVAYEAFRWRDGAGMIGLGDLPGGSHHSSAVAVSRDGSVVVGMGTGQTSGGESRREAFRWSASEGMIGLGHLPGAVGAGAALDVSGDGNIIVGNDGEGDGAHAFVWTEADGMRPLSEYLAEHGAEFTGWTLIHAAGISADGNTIVGTGIDPTGRAQAFVAVVPEPSSFSGIVTLAALTLCRGVRKRAHYVTTHLPRVA